MSIDDLNDLKQQREELNDQQRELEAEAFQVMKHRATYFALKLLLGISHKPKIKAADDWRPEITEEPATA